MVRADQTAVLRRWTAHPVSRVTVPTQILASLTGGVVLHDPLDLLTTRRRALAWYPDDIWRYVLAAGWLRVSQEEPFVGRTGGRGDDLGSRMLVARVARDLVRIGFLLERRWAPYGKWLTAAFAQLTLADQIGEHLHHALRATRWREREAALCAAASHLAAATNRLGLAEPVDPAPRRFHSRDIHVLGGERLTRALTDAISDPPPRLCTSAWAPGLSAPALIRRCAEVRRLVRAGDGVVGTARAFFVDRVGIDPADGTSEARTGSSQPRWPAHHPAAEWHHTTSTAEGIRSCG
ncbi:hypothetical protein Franean1_7140 [Parafrankia sp. EAN1pec]|uniref:DUF4037 domain-containing protein n=1 Tax=Parafrankia sp. (strain EAN1pec) TaxID=298653 RepID=UPI0000542581|nr:hypothetical protein Franean1_7140 [Frankia sp. EAN1pec]